MTPLQVRLETLGIMRDEDTTLLDNLQRRVSEYPAGCIVQPERGPIEMTRIVVSGWAMRYRSTADGDRQIVNFLIPGDSIGLYGALFEQSVSGVELITEATLAEFPCVELMDAFRQSARLGAALCWIGGLDERFLEQQIFRLGAFNATERIVHLLVELQQRLLAAGARPADATTMPITQKLIAEALGMSHVHANRCCRKLEKQGLLETGPHGLTLLEPAELKRITRMDYNTNQPIQMPAASVQRLASEAS